MLFNAVVMNFPISTFFKILSINHNAIGPLNSDKCKKLRINFSNQPREFDPVVIDGKELELVDSVDLLGVNVTNH